MPEHIHLIYYQLYLKSGKLAMSLKFGILMYNDIKQSNLEQCFLLSSSRDNDLVILSYELVAHEENLYRKHTAEAFMEFQPKSL